MLKRLSHFAKMPLKTITLNNSTTIPSVGYGTGTAWFGQDSPENSQGVTKAISVGFRHIDTAQVYKNEGSTGIGIAASNIPREQLFITTKQIDFSDPRATLEQQLKLLKTDHVDLLLIHDPTKLKSISETWKVYEELYAEGKAKAIGISNFKAEHVAELVKNCKIVPAVNQIELHPYNYTESKTIVDACRPHGIKIAAYSPQLPVSTLPDGPVTPILKKIADRLQISPGQVCLKWSQAKGDICVITSSKEERLKECLALDDLPNPTSEELDEITNAGKGQFYRKYMKHIFQ